MWIGIAVVLNVFLIVIFLTFRRIRMKRTRARANNINNETRKQIVLNSARPHEHEFKRSSKLSNLEVIQVYIDAYSCYSCYFFDLPALFIKKKKQIIACL